MLNNDGNEKIYEDDYDGDDRTKTSFMRITRTSWDVITLMIIFKSNCYFHFFVCRFCCMSCPEMHRYVVAVWSECRTQWHWAG